MVAPTCFGITLPSSGSVPSAFWEMLNWGAVERILWMGVLCLVVWCARAVLMLAFVKFVPQKNVREVSATQQYRSHQWGYNKIWRTLLPYLLYSGVIIFWRSGLFGSQFPKVPLRGWCGTTEFRVPVSAQEGEQLTDKEYMFFNDERRLPTKLATI
jgi:hypothetical protein